MLEYKTQGTKGFGITRKLMMIEISLRLVPFMPHVDHRGFDILEIAHLGLPPENGHARFRDQKRTGQKIILMGSARVNYDLSNHRGGDMIP
jgi:hypothetical protein